MVLQLVWNVVEWVNPRYFACDIFRLPRTTYRFSGVLLRQTIIFMGALPLPDAREFQAAVHCALRAWKAPGNERDSLLNFLLLTQEIQGGALEDGGPASLRLATNQVLLEAIEELTRLHPREAEVLQSHFLSGTKTRSVASRLNVTRDAVNRLQKVAIQQLSEILLRKEIEARKRRVLELESRLEPKQYDQLFGFEQFRDQIVQQLLRVDGFWVIVISGIGGIGKTALADSATRAVIQQLGFDEVAWVRANASHSSPSPERTIETTLVTLAEQVGPGHPDGATPRERLMRVREALKSKQHLVVIDNLETVADTEYILEHLGELTRPSKILITTRLKPTGQPSVFSVSLDELPYSEAAKLIRHYAACVDQNALASATDNDIDAIYRTVGGNPLALRLVVSMIGPEPLPRVLDDLSALPSESGGELFTRIYHRAWQTLTLDARTLLQAMPLVAEIGGTPAHLQAISRLSELQLWPAIRELVPRSLLEVRGSISARRYGIHRLTETFLRTEIVNAPAPKL